VDNLVEGLAAVSVKPLRVAFGGKVKPSLFEHTLDCKLEQHPLKADVDRLAEREQTLQEELKVLEEAMLDLTTTGRHQIRLKHMQADVIFKKRQQSVVRSNKYRLRQKMLRDILAAADVVSGLFHFASVLYNSHFADLHHMYYISG
jgi:hypothetical protein